MKKLLCLIFCAVQVFAQNPVRIVEGGTTKEMIFGAPGNRYFSGEITVTDSSVAVTTTTTYVQVIGCKTSSDASTITITNNEGTPVVHWDAVAIEANTVVIGSYGTVGMPFTSGIKVVASVSGAVKCHFVGVQ